MAIPKTTFVNPPAVEVRAEVRFGNQLRVADQRFTFHNLIKAEFPFVVIPEQKDLAFDFGDYSLYTENQAYRLEIAMNYFRLIATKYAGYQDFGKLLGNSLTMFARHYEIDKFTSFTLQYRNKLTIPSGAEFGEYFTVKIEVPAELDATLHAGRGMLVFQQDDGLILLEFDPQFSGKVPASYALNLTFAVERLLTIDDTANVFAKAHNRLTDFFFSILTPRFLEHLKRQ
jgi:uncharacterized protein (TIGR04255 family)